MTYRLHKAATFTHGPFSVMGRFHLWRGTRQRSQRGAFSSFLRVLRRDAQLVELFITFLLMLHLRGIDIT